MKQQFPYRFRILIFLFFLLIITYLDRNCIGLLGTRIKAEFHLNNEQFGWVMASFALAYALFEIPSGILADRIGQRALLIRIVLWWSLFTALTGLTTGLISLIIVRFLFGMGEAGVFPTCSGVISRWFPVAETARSISIIIIGQNVGSAIAPLLTITLASTYGWRSAFFINGLIGVCWVGICYGWFRNHPSEMRGISEKERVYIEEKRRFKTHNHNFKLKSIWKSRSLLILSVIHFCANWGFYFFIAWLPVYLLEGRHFSEHDMRLITAFVFVSGLIGISLSGFLSDCLVRKRGLLFSRRFFGVTVLGATAVALFTTGLTSDNTVVVVSLIIAYFFFPVNGITNFSVCIDIGGNHAGTAAGVMNFCGQMGAFIMLMMFGKLADVTHSYDIPVIIVAAVLLSGCLLWFLVDPRKQLNMDGHKSMSEMDCAKKI
jgi:ACS family glucarate transporter-like MFS transporter